MSTIGTTLKEPRVFAHDAIALSGLCRLPNTVSTLALFVTDAGTGYTAATTYATQHNGGEGATVQVTGVVGAGEVNTFVLVDGGQNYQAGDLLTLIGQGSNNNCTVQIVIVTACTPWTLGDPITPMPSNFDTVPYWDEKSSYTYTSSAVGNLGPHQTPGPGASLYVGVDMDITVINEATTEVEYVGVGAGSFLPVSVLSVVDQSAGDLDDILVLF